MSTQEKIKTLIHENPIMLFMKGNKEFPQCGFSKQVVEKLMHLTADFECFDVLSDQAVRDEIKVFSSWPTIPQLYVNGEFIGGCDIVGDLFNKGELAKILNVKSASEAPKISITSSALNAFRGAQEQESAPLPVRILINANFEHGLKFDEKNSDDFSIRFDDVEVIIDPISALRANNLSLDFVSDELESGFEFENPNEPAEVQDLSVEELKDWIEKKKDHLLIDVRPQDERDLAKIDYAKALFQMSGEQMAALDREMPIVFQCHHGSRSRRVAEKWRLKGFKNLFNLAGGIHAWSNKIDKDVPLY